MKSFTIALDVRPGQRPFGTEAVNVALPERDATLPNFLAKLADYVQEPILLNVYGVRLMDDDSSSTVAHWR